MSIVKLVKITMYGATSRQDETIDRLQDLGCVHLVDLRADDGETTGDPGLAVDARGALKYLRACPKQRRQAMREAFDRENVVSDTLEVQRRQRELADERDALTKAIRDLEPWGNFRLPSGGQIAGLRLWFFVVPIRDVGKLADRAMGLREGHLREGGQAPFAPKTPQNEPVPGASEPVPDEELIWHEAARDSRFAYVVVLDEGEPEDVPGTRVELDFRPLSELRDRLEDVEEQLDTLEYRRAGLTRFGDHLAEELDRADDAAARERAGRISQVDGNVFAIQGWAPQSNRATIERFAAQNGLALTIAAAESDDDPPTLLDNPEELKGGEGCVNFYKTPGYRMWDPSIVVFFSFAAFFAMILADAGYAALIGLLMLWAWKRLGASSHGRRFRSLLLALVGLSFGYGVLVNSFFGAKLLPQNLQVLDVADFGVMMPLSIGIGVFHLVLANAVTAWRQRGHAYALSAVGWACVLIGGSVAGIGYAAPIDVDQAEFFVRLGVVLFIGGIAAVFLFSSRRPLLTLDPKTHLLRVVDGVQGLLRFTNLFGDVLSYLRLFALGLSSARLAETFNALGMSSWKAGGMGVLLAIIILVVGHALNLLLALMSGVVHGLRLNCIEFFNWSLPEEGHLFRAFAKKARQP